MEIKKTIRLSVGGGEYDITVGHGLLNSADKFMKLDRKVLIVTDSGVPLEYAESVRTVCREAKIFIFEMGEESKNIRTFENILSAMLDFGMQRGDCVVAVGGGVVGDISGFAAASYMRGIDFYNIPTTLLSQVDSSIGGKCAIDFGGAKNIVGAFYQPKAVLIDTDVLSTLDGRQASAGLAEVIKMSMTFDKELFSKIEACDIKASLDDIIIGALEIKRMVVERDEREASLRKVLNFGHTFGHGIEAVSGLLHGECVALGMIPMCAGKVRARLLTVLEKCSLPTSYSYDTEAAFDFMRHDKKGSGDAVDAIFCEEIGSFDIKRTKFDDLVAHIRENII